MASNFIQRLNENKFINGIKKAPSAFVNALIGTPVQVQQAEMSVNNSYQQAINDFVGDMKNQEWAKPLFDKTTGYTDNQLVERIGNGLNDGYKQIADFQAQNNIRTPKTGEEINLANLGEFNKYPETLQISTGNEPRRGGFLRDLMAGARENYNEGFSPDNWGQQKNAATRIGEFLGSVGRFADSAPGRGLIAGGLIGALGGSPLEAAAYGISAGVGRQQTRAKDQLYRNRLAEQGIDTSNIRGNFDDTMFKNVSENMYKQQSLQVRQAIASASDNTKRAGMILTALNNGTMTPEEAKIQIAQYGITANDLQISNATRNANVNEVLAPHKANFYDSSSAVAMGSLGIRGQELGIKERKEAREAKKDQAYLDKLDELLPSGANSMVKVQNPKDGKIYNVPKSRVQEFINAGGKVIG